MFTWLASLVLQSAPTFPPRYDALPVVSFSYSYENNEFYSGFMMEDGSVAGNMRVVMGVHGEGDDTPFVWKDGTKINLPLGGASSAQLRFDHKGKLIGDVRLDDGYHPAIWTAHSQLGWKQASISIIRNGTGYVSAVGKDGAIYVTRQENNGKREIWKYANQTWTRQFAGLFNLAGVDDRGRLFGDVFRNLMEGYRPQNTRPAMIAVGKVIPFSREEKTFEYDQCNDVNGAGVAVGRSDGRACVWTNGKIQFLHKKTERAFSSACDINATGRVLFDFPKGNETHVAIWQSGLTQDLTVFLPSNSLSARSINNRGDILIAANNGKMTTLYVLKAAPPRPK